MYPDLIFIAQSAALRVWAGTLTADELAAESTLPGWTVADVIGHLVAVHDAVAALRPTGDAGGATGSESRRDGSDAGTPNAPTPNAPAPNPPAAGPLTVAEFVAGYAGDANRVADVARTIARDTAADPLAGWDSAAEQARRTLGALGAADRLVTTRRGPMLVSAYLTTRVIELVVHADDLARSIPKHPAPPVLPSARAHVLTALREVLTSRDGDPAVLAAASSLGEQEFADLATGREEPGEDTPAALASLLPLL